MAIQLRRGAYENYDASKLKPAEVGVVQSGDPNTTDGKAVYIAINTNDVKRIPTADEMVDHNAEAEGIYENIVAQNQTASQLFQNTSIKAAEAEQSASSASSASASANSSMQRAETAANLLTNVTATAQTLETGQQATASYNNGVFSFGLPKGDTGNTGAKGDKGDTGATPNLSVGTVTTLEPGSDATVEITGTAEAPVLNMGIPRGNTGEVSAEQFYKAFATDTVTGAIASFADGADSIPMKDVLVHIEPVQAGSGDPSPDNVRPITGWTGAKVTRTGKNLLPPPVAETFTQNGVTVTASPDGSYTAVGTTSGGSFIHQFALSKPITIKNDMYWHVMNDDICVSCSVALISEGKNIKDITLSPKNRIVDLSNVIGKTIDAYQFYVANNQETNITLKPMFVLNSTATAYESYSGETYDITFPSEAGTVYGGTLDVTSGMLTVDRAYLELGSKHWAKVANKTSVYVSAFGSPVPLAIGIGDVANMLCTCYKVASATNVFEESVPCSIAQGRPGLYADYWIINDATHANEGVDLENYLNGQYICYLLATPITYTLTPQEITSLLGANNVWADTGNTKVEYRASTKMYIDKKITEAVSALS